VFDRLRIDIEAVVSDAAEFRRWMIRLWMAALVLQLATILALVV